MKPQSAWGSLKNPVKFKIPTAENLIPIRLDIEIDGQRFKDAFSWNPNAHLYRRNEILVSHYNDQESLVSKFVKKLSGHAHSRRYNIECASKLLNIGFYEGILWKAGKQWNFDPDSEVVVFAKRTVKDLKLPPGFITQIAQSIQSQLTEFRSYEGQDMYTGERVVPIKLDLRVNHTVIKDHFFWDLNNFESDPEEFARTFCKDMEIEDPEVGPAIAISIREQLYEIAMQSVASARESRANKKRRVTEHISASKTGVPALDLVKLFGIRSSVVRKRKDWDVYEPIVDLLSNEEVDALEAREEKIAR